MDKTSKASSGSIDLRRSTFCILLKVVPDLNINKDDQYHNYLIYYPIDRIIDVDSKEVQKIQRRFKILYLIQNTVD